MYQLITYSSTFKTNSQPEKQKRKKSSKKGRNSKENNFVYNEEVKMEGYFFAYQKNFLKISCIIF